jgi:hypothetical protein
MKKLINKLPFGWKYRDVVLKNQDTPFVYQKLARKNSLSVRMKMNEH